MKRAKYFKGTLPGFLYIDEDSFISTMFYARLGNTSIKNEKFHITEHEAIKYLNKNGYRLNY